MAGLSRTIRIAVWALAAQLVANGWPSAAAAPLFESDTVLEVELSADQSAIDAGRRSNSPKYQDGTLYWRDAAGTEQQVPVRVRARGNYRKRECAYPPLRLNFKTSDVPGTLFEGQDKLKLVRPCSSLNRAEQWVVLEYLVYVAYGALTDQSFRVRPMIIRYTDEERSLRGSRKFGFVIEDDDQMAARIGGDILKTSRINRRTLDARAQARLDLFQYMIGNNDFSPIRASRGEVCCHNIKLVRRPGAPLTPVPYDFDFSGFVHTDYATPPTGVRIRHVRQRYYRGYCAPADITAETREQVSNAQAAIIEQVRAFAPLENRRRADTIDYLEEFFAIINTPARFERLIIRRCR